MLDIGGGTGGFAVRVAELGHRVSVIDPSPDALAALDRRAREQGSGRHQQGDVADLLEVTGPASADVVLCHGVLEVVDDPAAALATIRQVASRLLSLLVGQRHAAVVARAMAGHFQQALGLLDDTVPSGRSGTGSPSTSSPGCWPRPASGSPACTASASSPTWSPAPCSTSSASSALVALEHAVSERPEYLPLATQRTCSPRSAESAQFAGAQTPSRRSFPARGAPSRRSFPGGPCR